MLGYSEIKIILLKLECKPYLFRFDCMQCVRRGSNINYCTDKEHSWFLQAQLYRKDTNSDEMGFGSGRKYFISPHMTEGEVVKTALVAALAYAEHEVREAFTYKGKRVLGPHIAIDALGSIADTTETRKKTVNV